MTMTEKKPRRILVCGGRKFSDNHLMNVSLDRVREKYVITSLIEGDAQGADRMAGRWAELRNIPVRLFPADWDRHGRRAGYLRNQQMLDEGRPDVVIAFDGGVGTQMMIDLATKAGVTVWDLRSSSETD